VISELFDGHLTGLHANRRRELADSLSEYLHALGDIDPGTPCALLLPPHGLVHPPGKTNRWIGVPIAAITRHKLETVKKILEVYMPRTTKMAARAIVARIGQAKRDDDSATKKSGA
jgi:hypothetical protein